MSITMNQNHIIQPHCSANPDCLSLFASCTPLALFKFLPFTPLSPRLSKLRLMALVMVTNARSTFDPSRALVSTKGICRSRESASPSLTSTCRSVSARSILLPTSTVSKFSPPSCSARSYQFFTCSKESRRVTSYTSKAPCAPRLQHQVEWSNDGKLIEYDAVTQWLSNECDKGMKKIEVVKQGTH